MSDSHPWLKRHIFQSDSLLFKFGIVPPHAVFSYAASLCLLPLIALPRPHVCPQHPPGLCGHKPTLAVWGRLEDLLPHPRKRNPRSSGKASHSFITPGCWAYAPADRKKPWKVLENRSCWQGTEVAVTPCPLQEFTFCKGDFPLI